MACPITITLPSFTSGASPEAADAALRDAVRAHARAEHDVVIWFAEIQRRRLHTPLGYGSMLLYATQALGFSRTKSYQLIRIGEALRVHEPLWSALASGQLEWTKAREILDVVTITSVEHWIDRACTLSRRKLRAEVERTKAAARKARSGDRSQYPLVGTSPPASPQPGSIGGAGGGGDAGGGAGDGAALSLSKAQRDRMQTPVGEAESHSAPRTDGETYVSSQGGAGGAGGARGPGGPGGADPEPLPPDVPRTVSLRFDPEQHAVLEALLTELRKAGARGSREELIVEGLEAALSLRRGAASRARRAHSNGGDEPVVVIANRPPYQVYIRLCPSCDEAVMHTSRGEEQISYAKLKAILQDCDIIDPALRRRSTIPPKVRRAIYRRDGFRCRAPGCGRPVNLSVHHVDPVSAGGKNSVANGVTICTSCHVALHANTPRGRELRRWRQSILDEAGREAGADTVRDATRDSTRSGVRGSRSSEATDAASR